MKRIFTGMAAVAISMAASANLVNWKYSGVEADTGASVYLYVGSEAPASFDSLEKLIAASINTGESVTSTYLPRSKTYSYAAFGSASKTDWAAGDSYYYVLVSADGSGYYVDSIKNTVASSNIYAEGEPAADQINTSSTGSHTYAAFSGGGSGGGEEPVTPEPTSGILLLVGGALLGLRRKRA